MPSGSIRNTWPLRPTTGLNRAQWRWHAVTNMVWSKICRGGSQLPLRYLSNRHFYRDIIFVEYWYSINLP